MFTGIAVSIFSQKMDASFLTTDATTKHTWSWTFKLLTPDPLHSVQLLRNFDATHANDHRPVRCQHAELLPHLGMGASSKFKELSSTDRVSKLPLPRGAKPRSYCSFSPQLLQATERGLRARSPALLVTVYPAHAKGSYF